VPDQDTAMTEYNISNRYEAYRNSKYIILQGASEDGVDEFGEDYLHHFLGVGFLVGWNGDIVNSDGPRAIVLFHCIEALV
jgi:hypothetical protein